MSTGSVVAVVALAIVFHSRSKTSASSRISARLSCPAPSSRAPKERGVGAAKAEAHARRRELTCAPGTCHKATARVAERRTVATRSPQSGPRLSTLPRAGRAAERVGGQAREGKGEEGGREGKGEARPRGGGALSRGLPGSLAAAVVMSAMLAMAQGADRAGERRI